jgi:hypothetical protein
MDFRTFNDSKEKRHFFWFMVAAISVNPIKHLRNAGMLGGTSIDTAVDHYLKGYIYWKAPCFASAQHRFSVTCCRVLRKQQQQYRNAHKDTIVECPNPECDFYCTFADDDVNFQANPQATENGAECQGVHGYLQQ